MKLPRRKFLQLTAGAAALPAVARIARAQSYPRRPVRIVAPTAPGGAPDILAQLIGPWLSGRLGQPFVIDNRPGAGTNIGTEAVVPSGRLHTSLGEHYEHDQRDTLRQAQLQFHSRHRAGRWHHSPPFGHGGKSIRSGQNSSRVHCSCQGEPAQDQFGIARHRNPRPCCWRAIQDDGWARLGSRAVSWRGSWMMADSHFRGGGTRHRSRPPGKSDGTQEVMVWAVPSRCGLLLARAVPCPALWRELTANDVNHLVGKPERAVEWGEQLVA
jgi:hypothetical protein